MAFALAAFLLRKKSGQTELGNSVQHGTGREGLDHPSLGTCGLTLFFARFLAFGGEHVGVRAGGHNDQVRLREGKDLVHVVA